MDGQYRSDQIKSDRIRARPHQARDAEAREKWTENLGAGEKIGDGSRSDMVLKI